MEDRPGRKFAQHQKEEPHALGVKCTRRLMTRLLWATKKKEEEKQEWAQGRRDRQTKKKLKRVKKLFPR